MEKSPFRWAGGKYYARKMILDCIPEHDYYVEPFVGGGSIFFAKKKVKHNWLNDKDPNLANVYIQMRDNPKDLIDFLKDESVSKERHYYYKHTFSPKNDLERAGRYYFLNRISYSGIMNNKNCYFGYDEKYSVNPKKWGDLINSASEKLQDVKITCLDFEDVFNGTPNDNVLMFIDPPYFKAKQKGLYEHSFSDEDHIRLRDSLKSVSQKHKVLVTYDNCQEIRNMYDFMSNVSEKEWAYMMTNIGGNSKETKRNQGKELFLRNY